MAEKEPPRVRAYLPKLGHTTITTLLDQGPGAIKMLAATNGHGSVIGAHVVEEGSYEEASMRAAAATKSVRSNIPVALQEGICRGKKYWHKVKETYVTVIQCNAGQFASGVKKHRVVDDEGNSFLAAESNLETV